MSTQEWWALLVLATATSFTPGPNTTLSATLAANGGLRAAMRFVFAVPVGWGLLLLIGSLGFGALVLAVPALRWVIVLAGSAYLCWLAWRLANSHRLQDLSQAPLRVGFWQGAHRPTQVRRAMRTGLGLSAALAACCCLGLWLGKEVLASAFTTDPEVARIAAALLAWVVVYHAFDAIQTVCAFLLRCFQITLLPLLIYSVLLWGVGLGGGYVWAYQGIGKQAALPEPHSFWLTSTAALAVVMLLFLGLTYRAANQSRTGLPS